LRYGSDFRLSASTINSPGQGSGTFSFDQNSHGGPGVSDPRTGNAFASFSRISREREAMRLVSDRRILRSTPDIYRIDFSSIPRSLSNLAAATIRDGLQEKQKPGYRSASIPTYEAHATRSAWTSRAGSSPGVRRRNASGRSEQNQVRSVAGFAWTPAIVVRGGYGIFYSPEEVHSPSTTAWGLRLQR